MTLPPLTLSDKQLAALARHIAEASDPDRWRTKEGTAAFFACGVRTVEAWQADGAPHKTIAGKVKFRPRELEAWLADQGHIKEGGGANPRRHLDRSGTVDETGRHRWHGPPPTPGG